MNTPSPAHVTERPHPAVQPQPLGEYLADTAFLVAHTTLTVTGMVANAVRAVHEERVAQRAENQQIVTAFAELPVDQQDAYFAVHAKDQRAQTRLVLGAPRRWLQGLFTLSAD